MKGETWFCIFWACLFAFLYAAGGQGVSERASIAHMIGCGIGVVFWSALAFYAELVDRRDLL